MQQPVVNLASMPLMHVHVSIQRCQRVWVSMGWAVWVRMGIAVRYVFAAVCCIAACDLCACMHMMGIDRSEEISHTHILDTYTHTLQHDHIHTPLHSPPLNPSHHVPPFLLVPSISLTPH